MSKGNIKILLATAVVLMIVASAIPAMAKDPDPNPTIKFEDDKVKFDNFPVGTAGA